MCEILNYGSELYTLIKNGRVDGIPLHRLATAVAEETGECIGAHNKYCDGRESTTEHFRIEWAQAMLMLMMLGSVYMSPEMMVKEMDTEMNRQYIKWDSSNPTRWKPRVRD